MKEHFEQTLNETEHLEYMEFLGGNAYWGDRFFAKHLVMVYYWIMVFYYLIDPKSAYDLNAKVELHATETYLNYLSDHPDDEKIATIACDEMNHYVELLRAMEKIS